MTFFDVFKKPVIYKFFVVGIGGSLIVLILTFVFTSLFDIFYIVSTIFAFEISLLWGFFANDRWTFGEIKKTSKGLTRFIKYNLFSLISLGIIQMVMISLVNIMNFHYSLSEAIGIVVAFFFNFTVSKNISFKN